jgi:hypothetical protein
MNAHQFRTCPEFDFMLQQLGLPTGSLDRNENTRVTARVLKAAHDMPVNAKRLGHVMLFVAGLAGAYTVYQGIQTSDAETVAGYLQNMWSNKHLRGGLIIAGFCTAMAACALGQVKPMQEQYRQQLARVRAKYAPE